MQYIIFLRGVNVGSRIIKMAELKACFEKNGYQNVQTILQSGNVILEITVKDPVKVKKKIEHELKECFNYPAQVHVISRAALEKIVDAFPFADAGPDFHRYVIFTEKGLDSELTAAPANLDKQMEEVAPGEGVVYWRVQKGFTLDSNFGKATAKFSVKKFTTTRNVNTLEKVLAKCK